MNQPYAPLPPTVRTSTMAIVSLIGGITGLTILPMIGSLAAVIFGHIAKNEIKKSNGTITGNGMATAGLILGYVTLGLGICSLCLVFVILPLIFGISLFSMPVISNYGY